MIGVEKACKVILANIQVREGGMTLREIIEHHCRKGGIREEIARQAVDILLELEHIVEQDGKFIVPPSPPTSAWVEALKPFSPFERITLFLGIIAMVGAVLGWAINLLLGCH